MNTFRVTLDDLASIWMTLAIARCRHRLWQVPSGRKTTGHRWVGPHEQVLNVLIACRRYEPGNPSSPPSTEGGFTPTTSMAILGEKLSMDPRISLVCCGLCREAFFSGVVVLSIIVDDFAKGWYVLTVWDTYDLGQYVDWVWDVYDMCDIPPLSRPGQS
jgi:hypothetical protein